MSTERVSITLDTSLLSSLKADAKAEKMSLSAYIEKLLCRIGNADTNKGITLDITEDGSMSEEAFATRVSEAEAALSRGEGSMMLQGESLDDFLDRV